MTQENENTWFSELVISDDTIDERKAINNALEQLQSLKELQYIKDGEPLTGQNGKEIGVLNRTAKELYQIVVNITSVLNKLTNKTTEQNQEVKPLQDYSIEIQSLQEQLAEFREQVMLKFQSLQKTQQKSQNFLDYQIIQEIEQKISNLETRANRLSQNNQGQPGQVGVQAEDTRVDQILVDLTQISNRLNELTSVIGEFNKDDGTGFGLQNKVEQTLQLANQNQRLIERNSTELSESQQEQVTSIVNQRTLDIVKKSGQNESVAIELFLKLEGAQAKLDKLLNDYSISDLPELSTLGSYLTELQTNVQNCLNTQSAINQEFSEIKQTTEANNLLSSQNKTQLDDLQTKVNQLELSLTNITQQLGSADNPQQLLGVVQLLPKLSQEYSQNIQEINMKIGQNITGEETGIYKLLNESQQHKTRYYRVSISPEQLSDTESSMVVLELPEYVAVKGNDFILSDAGNLHNISQVYNSATKQILIDKQLVQENQQILILPINVEDLIV